MGDLRPFAACGFVCGLEQNHGWTNSQRVLGRAALKHFKHQFKPEELLHFIELPQFTARWKKLGLDDEDDLATLQLSIMVDPKAAQVIEGTGGLRKFRFAPRRWKTGSSGAVRILYVYFEKFGIVLLVLAYAKNELDNISAAVKEYLSALISDQERELRRRKRL